jgi:hypothetical protein
MSQSPCPTACPAIGLSVLAPARLASGRPFDPLAAALRLPFDHGPLVDADMGEEQLLLQAMVATAPMVATAASALAPTRLREAGLAVGEARLSAGQSPYAVELVLELVRLLTDSDGQKRLGVMRARHALLGSS